jgi:hypothetical protein
MFDDPAFVLPTPDVASTTHEGLELYLPSGADPAPAVLLIHGVPYSAEGRPVPSAWNIYQGYGSQLADRHTDESRQAVTAALNAVSAALAGEAGA